MKITKKTADKLSKKYNIDHSVVSKEDWHFGLNVELEHGTKYGALTNITNNNSDLTARIVIAHLLESPDYYTRLKNMETKMDMYWSSHNKPSIFL